MSTETNSSSQILSNESGKRNFEALNGLRVYACFGVIMVHMASPLNNNYALPSMLSNAIERLSLFLFVFMILSSFGLCCGYFKKILSGKQNLSDFYKKRYSKILPFFSFVVMLELVFSFSKSSLIEAFADLTLTIGLFHNNITVIGVGWFLGLVFAFYMIFPFFCTLIETKKKAWFFFVISILLNFSTRYYFGLTRVNIVYCLCYFFAGGLIYQYLDDLLKIKKYITIPLAVIGFALYMIYGGYTLLILFSAVTIVICCLNANNFLLTNKAILFVSKLSLEIYLSHMIIFRVFEKLHLNTILGYGLLQYFFTVISVFIGSIIFVVIYKKVSSIVVSFISSRIKSIRE